MSSPTLSSQSILLLLGRPPSPFTDRPRISFHLYCFPFTWPLHSEQYLSTLHSSSVLLPSPKAEPSSLKSKLSPKGEKALTTITGCSTKRGDISAGDVGRANQLNNFFNRFDPLTHSHLTTLHPHFPSCPAWNQHQHRERCPPTQDHTSPGGQRELRCFILAKRQAKLEYPHNY